MGSGPLSEVGAGGCRVPCSCVTTVSRWCTRAWPAGEHRKGRREWAWSQWPGRGSWRMFGVCVSHGGALRRLPAGLCWKGPPRPAQGGGLYSFLPGRWLPSIHCTPQGMLSSFAFRTSVCKMEMYLHIFACVFRIR